jgi:hypothetical protein
MSDGGSISAKEVRDSRVDNKDIESSNAVAAADVGVTTAWAVAACAVAIEVAVGIADQMLAAWQVADGVAFREIVRWQMRALRFADMQGGAACRVGDGCGARQWRA